MNICWDLLYMRGFPGGSDGKESACNAGDPDSIPGLEQLTPVFLPGETHGQKSLANYSPWGHKMPNTAEWLTHTHTHTLCIRYVTDNDGQNRPSWCFRVYTIYQRREKVGVKQIQMIEKLKLQQIQRRSKTNSKRENKTSIFAAVICIRHCPRLPILCWFGMFRTITSTPRTLTYSNWFNPHVWVLLFLLFWGWEKWDREAGSTPEIIP